MKHLILDQERVFLLKCLILQCILDNMALFCANFFALKKKWNDKMFDVALIDARFNAEH